MKYIIVSTLAVIVAVVSVAADAQQLRDPGQKSVQMVRTATPPVIDGVLDEAVWQQAALVDNLHQVTPVEYAEPYERSEIYLLYDDDALYIGARLYDTDPEHITAQNLRQNDSIGEDDRFYVTLDPFNDRRSGYYFGVNPNGVRQDGLYRNVTEFYSAWDSIYYAQAGRFEGGWIAEIAIPFKSLSFDPNTDTWGLNFSRGVPRKNENMAWVSRNRQYNPSASGLAIGFEGLKQGVGLDIVASGSARSSRVYETQYPVDTPTGAQIQTIERSREDDFEPSLDVAYRLTSSLNASLTVNTDFSATEVDDRQVNLTRFGLFFPEKRDFFLREADIFEFGGIGAQSDSVYNFGGGGQNGRPFFSRRIGLNNAGQIVDLDYGGKVSGRVGNWELGALSIRQAAYGAVDADTLSVVRAKLNVLSESSVGFIATDGNPGSNTDNSLAGFDFLYRNTRLPGGRLLEAEAWMQQSDSGEPGDDAAAGIGFQLPSAQGFRGAAGFKRFESGFNPALGFINRRGITDATFDLGYTYRPGEGRIQSVVWTLDGQRIDRIDGGLQSQSLNMRPFQITNSTGDRLFMVYRDVKEVLLEPFEIWRGIEIPEGEYAFSDLGIQLQTSSHRHLAGSVRLVDGTFYDGTRADQNVSVTWRPSAKFRGSVSYALSEIKLPQGNFETRLMTMGIDYVFSSTLSWVNLIQYDNNSEIVGINMRLHWIPQAGRELFFVINHNLQDFDNYDNSFEPLSADLTLKYTHTFRF
jgi:hypothetical protein